MSETTNKMRDVAIYSDSLIRVRDLAADAINAVEAQVAAVAARVDAAERWAGVKLQAPASTVASASPAAPSAVPAPRGFKKGDKVRHRDYPDEVWTVRHSPNVHGLVICDTPRPERWGAELAYHAVDDFLTLVRAADAPEAPAEDAGLVERCAKAAASTGVFTHEWPRPLVRAILSVLRAEGRPLEPGQTTAFLADAVATWTDRCGEAQARAEAAEKDLAEARAISAATAERVRNETQIATELRKDLADARDRIASKDRSIEVMLAETRALREALDAERSGVATKLHDAGFNNVENLVGAYRFERAQADALRFSARTWFNEKGEPELLATAEEVTERRKAAAKELAALKSKPRFRTRKVTKADVEDFIAHDGCFYESLRALGFRRRVDGAK